MKSVLYYVLQRLSYYVSETDLWVYSLSEYPKEVKLCLQIFFWGYGQLFFFKSACFCLASFHSLAGCQSCQQQPIHTFSENGHHFGYIVFSNQVLVFWLMFWNMTCFSLGAIEVCCCKLCTKQNESSVYIFFPFSSILNWNVGKWRTEISERAEVAPCLPTCRKDFWIHFQKLGLGDSPLSRSPGSSCSQELCCLGATDIYHLWSACPFAEPTGARVLIYIPGLVIREAVTWYHMQVTTGRSWDLVWADSSSTACSGGPKKSPGLFRAFQSNHKLCDPLWSWVLYCLYNMEWDKSIPAEISCNWCQGLIVRLYWYMCMWD